MSNRFRWFPVKEIRFLSAAVLASALAFVSAPVQAQAVRSLHRIEVFQADDVCYYQIQEQTNQDLLRITPLGAVVFQARGEVKVRIEIEDVQTTAGRVAGAAGEKNATLDAGRPVQSLAVRGARGESTEHKIQIQCCPERRLFRCQWSDAQPVSASREVGQRLDGRSPSGGATEGRFWAGDYLVPPQRGPNAGRPVPEHTSSPERIHLPERIPTLPPVGPGGPVMKIEE